MQNKPSLDAIRNLLPAVQELEWQGEGGFKVVCKALIEGKLEALKVVYIPSDAERGERYEENSRRVHREIDALRKCSSKNLVKLGTVEPTEYRIGEWYYIIYSEEFLQGESLSAQIGRGYKPGINELVDLGLSLIDAVSCLWGLEEKLVHRDIKPDNVMALNNVERPFVLLDLGIAFAVEGTPLTANPQYVLGTREYYAPEMLKPGFREMIDFRSDLYAMGLTLYEYASTSSGLNCRVEFSEFDAGVVGCKAPVDPLSLCVS